MNTPPALIDGRPATALALTDRGLHYGDGVFRSIRIVAGRARAWPWQLQRLAHDCERLALPPPSRSALAGDRDRLFADGGDGMLKIIVTRGSGGRGYAPPLQPAARRLSLRYPAPAYPPEYTEEGVVIGIGSTHLAAQPRLAGIKHLNRLEQVLARRECDRRGWPEALMPGADGRVVCGTMSNLFVVRDGILITPAITDAGVLGATRQRLLAACAAHDRTCQEGTLYLNDMLNADELFLCNSAMELWPVTAVGERRFTPGAVTAWCRARLAE